MLDISEIFFVRMLMKSRTSHIGTDFLRSDVVPDTKCQELSVIGKFREN